MKNLKVYIISGLVLLGLGYVAGRYLQPADIEVREVIKEVEKVKRDVVVIEKKTTTKDGTVIEEKITKDKSEIETAKTSDKTIKESRRNDYQIGLGIATNSLSSVPVYEAQIHKRMFGPVLLGVRANTEGEVGVIVSLEF